MKSGEMTDREFDCPRCGHCCPQPEQEPVKDRLDFWALFDENQRLRAELKSNTTPPQQWVGLTDEEIGVPTEPIQPNEAIMFARVIEALIKGKNT